MEFLNLFQFKKIKQKKRSKLNVFKDDYTWSSLEMPQYLTEIYFLYF